MREICVFNNNHFSAKATHILIRCADSYKLAYIIIYYFQSMLVFTVLFDIALEMSKIPLKWHVATGKVLSTYSEI